MPKNRACERSAQSSLQAAFRQAWSCSGGPCSSPRTRSRCGSAAALSGRSRSSCCWWRSRPSSWRCGAPHRGERISQRMQAKRALLDHHSPKRAIGRRAGLAVAGLAVPLTLIAIGVGSHIPSPHAAPAARVTKVTRVVRVVKPVRVERVVKVKTVAQQVPASTVYQASPAVNRSPARHVQSIRRPAPRSPPPSRSRRRRIPVCRPLRPRPPRRRAADPPPSSLRARRPPWAPRAPAAQPTT